MTDATSTADTVAQTPAPEIPTPQEMPSQTPSSPEMPGQPETPTPYPQTPGPDITPPPPSPVPQQPPTPVQNILRRGLERIRFRKRAKLEKIVALAQKKGSITNDDVQQLLIVSDSTAQRYLGELVSTGRLRRSGNTITTSYRPV